MLRVQEQALVAVLIGLALVGTAVPSAQAQGRVTVYTALSDTHMGYLVKQFEVDTGIHIEFIGAGAGTIVARIIAEARNPRASIMVGGSVDNFVTLMQKGLLAQYRSPEIVSIPKQYHDPKGVWSPLYLGVLVIGANSQLLSEKNIRAPGDFADLIGPQFKGEVALAHPATSGTAYTFVATLVQQMGEDRAFQFLRDLRRNGARIIRSTAAAIDAIALGENLTGVAFAHDWYLRIAEGYPVEIVVPRSATGYEIGAMALIANGPKGEEPAARRLVDWLLAPRAQGLHSAVSYKLAIHPKAALPKGVIRPEQVRLIDYDFEWAGTNRERLIERFAREVAPRP
jgi:iron(III) transport system substrate-binding protein